jgi:hypothetical protein
MASRSIQWPVRKSGIKQKPKKNVAKTLQIDDAVKALQINDAVNALQSNNSTADADVSNDNFLRKFYCRKSKDNPINNRTT